MLLGILFKTIQITNFSINYFSMHSCIVINLPLIFVLTFDSCNSVTIECTDFEQSKRPEMTKMLPIAIQALNKNVCAYIGIVIIAIISKRIVF